MSTPTHTVAETGPYLTEMKRLGVSQDERDRILDKYQGEPDFGDVIKGTGGWRKGRVDKDDTGKSGGYRIISWFGGLDFPVYLNWILNKTKDEDLTKAQEKQLKKLSVALKGALRKNRGK